MCKLWIPDTDFSADPLKRRPLRAIRQHNVVIQISRSWSPPASLLQARKEKEKKKKKSCLVNQNVCLRKTSRTSLQHNSDAQAAYCVFLSTSACHDLFLHSFRVCKEPNERQLGGIRDVCKSSIANCWSNRHTCTAGRVLACNTWFENSIRKLQRWNTLPIPPYWPSINSLLHQKQWENGSMMTCWRSQEHVICCPDVATVLQRSVIFHRLAFQFITTMLLFCYCFSVAALSPDIPSCLRQNKDEVLLKNITMELQTSRHSKQWSPVTSNDFKFLASFFLYVLSIRKPA